MRMAAAVFARIRPGWLLGLSALLLAVHPALWLFESWRDPAYNPQGLWVAAAVLALFAWSYSSEQLPGSESNRRYAFALLALSALVRLAGQVLRVNVLGALTLALDVYALATLAGLRQRRRAVSPFWLALLFAFSLPLERIVQRLLGYGLQQLSASGACGVLGLLVDELQCHGTRILLAGQDLLVDLPCSGARGLMLVLMLFVGLCALRRPRPLQALLGLALALIGALLGNLLRLVLLALGLAYMPTLDLMAGPAHEALGLLSLTLSALPVALWALRLPVPRPRAATATLRSATPLSSSGRASSRARLAALAFLGFSLFAVSAPARPVDVARSVPPPLPPPRIGLYAAQPQPLAPVEVAYFARYGGGAAKAGYGPFGLLLVSTSAPLRHLHAPDECLRGSGHRVRYLGLAHGALPSALYRSTDAQGQEWRVAVSYVSDRGETAASVAEAVWRWLQAPGATWTMVQRIAPWALDDAEREAWDAGLLRVLDLPVAPPQRFHRVPET